MTIPTTYAQLKTEIANWLKRDDLTNDLETFIKIGEARINRISRLVQQESTATVTMTTSQAYANQPTGFIEAISFRYTTTDEYITKISLEELEEMRLSSAGNSKPYYYATSGTRLEFEYPADSGYTPTMRYWKKWDIAGDTTNWLLTNNPDAYIYTALEASGMFLKHPLMDRWERAAEKVISEIEYESSRNRKSKLRVDYSLLRGGNSNIMTG